MESYNLTLRDRLEKLDDAFLFSLSSAGLLISFIQLGQKGLEGLLEISPFLFLGIILPFGVGYLRGAVEKNSTEERVRGWIYLIIGLGSNFAFFLSTRIRFFPPYEFTIFMLPIFYVTYRFVKWLCKIFGIDGRTASQYAFSGTIMCGISLAFWFRMLISLYHDLLNLTLSLSTLPIVMFFISIILASFSFVLIFEKASSKVLETRAKLSTSSLPLLVRKYSVFKGIFLGSQLFDHAFGICLKAQFFWLQGFGFWVIGSLLMKANCPVFPHIFLGLSIIFIIVGAIIFYSKKQIDFSTLTRNWPTTVFNLGLIASIIVVVVLYPL